jgi:hypothetical protein
MQQWPTPGDISVVLAFIDIAKSNKARILDEYLGILRAAEA